MQPKISIIIPVYKVEKYLRQCLDSVVNQTMQDIQIICVNDGSPDGSRAILQEYADRDSRIEIIDKSNGGLSSARNAAYPSIKGKYMLFVDSDDWIELDACEKLFAKAEQTGAEIVFFFWKKEYLLKSKVAKIRQISLQDKLTAQEKMPLLEHGCYVWNKLWRSDFLFENHLHFLEGMYYEDCLFSWQGTTKARKISVVPEYLYHYRYNLKSITSTPACATDTVSIYNEVEKYLRESGYYEDYQDIFIRQKLLHWQHSFDMMARTCRAMMLPLIRKSLTTEDRQFYSDGKRMRTKAIWFYRGVVDSNRRDAMKYYFFDSLKLLERLFKYTVVNPMRRFIEY